MEKKDFLILNKLQIKKDDNSLLPKSFIFLIIGKPGSGKTTLIEEMLLNNKLLNKKYEYIIIVSPSPFINLNLSTEEEESVILKSFDLDQIYNKIDFINIQPEKKEIHLLIIFDDVIGDIKKSENDPRLKSLFFNRRHILKNGIISILIVSQRYLVIPPFIRSTATLLIYFKLQEKEYKTIYEEHLSWMDKKKMKIENDFDFIYINLNKGVYNKNFLKNESF